ncbi:hypothetical protein [Haloarcula sp. 1CSR25-25]|uniref:DUF7558 family protein n=1 Tax=Haloarcula sp. 1CSR25-25 TaxID=2862545 RepID=UPI00289DDA94|nr:hypothetical protein [Haloarcula sp. 1CSR25-25]
MECPAFGGPVTMEVGPTHPLSASVGDALLAADEDEQIVVACDGCRLVVDTLAALTRFRVELGHLEGPLQLCARCSPGGLATYWTRDLEEHLVSDCCSAERGSHCTHENG